MIIDWSIAIPLGLIDMVVAFTVSWATMRYMQYKNDMLIKKRNPTEKNGWNLDISYRQDGYEGFGIHSRGAEITELITNIGKGQELIKKEWDKHGEDKPST